jgi:hypothetical protein
VKLLTDCVKLIRPSVAVEVSAKRTLPAKRGAVQAALRCTHFTSRLLNPAGVDQRIDTPLVEMSKIAGLNTRGAAGSGLHTRLPVSVHPVGVKPAEQLQPVAAGFGTEFAGPTE